MIYQHTSERQRRGPRRRRQGQGARRRPTRSLPLDQIIAADDLQARKQLSDEVIEEYRNVYSNGETMPPVVVFSDDDEFWLADGFHRLAAAKAAGLEELPCEVRHGDRVAAAWYAAGSNQRHGLRRTVADKQRAVEKALAHPRATEMSDAAIAQHVGVTDRMVSKYRKQKTAPNRSQSRPGKDGRAREVSSEKQQKVADSDASERLRSRKRVPPDPLAALRAACADLDDCDDAAAASELLRLAISLAKRAITLDQGLLGTFQQAVGAIEAGCGDGPPDSAAEGDAEAG